ncbi:MAG: hypothetical protein QXX20_03210 [Candidatus Thermoplasmatota archaeon]
MMKRKNLLKDDWARIPFSIIGVFLLIGSSITTVYISQLENQKSKEISTTIETNDIDPIVKYVEADLARCLNYAACSSLNEIGKNPVVVPLSGTELYFDVNYDNTINEVDVNINRMRVDTYYLLSKLVHENFKNGRYTAGKYNVTVTMPTSWREVTLEKNIIKLMMSRVLDNGCKNEYPVYPVLRVNMSISVNDTILGKTVFTKKSVIMTVITNRYPLLEELTREFDSRLNGSWSSFGINSLIFLMPMTWIHAWAQYKTNKPLNIVSTTWLEFVTNSALLLEEGFVFNSVDPVGLVYTGFGFGRAVAEDITMNPDSLEDISATILSEQVQNPIGTNNFKNNYDAFARKFGETPLTSDQLQFTPEVNISKVCKEEADYILGDPDGKTITTVLNAYSAEVYTRVTRTTYQHNQRSINNSVNAAYTDDSSERERDGEARAQAEAMGPPCPACGNWSFAGVSFQRMYTSRITQEFTDLQVSEARFQKNIEFDNRNVPVVLGGESWKIKRTQTQTYSWSSWSSWTATWRSDKSSCSPCATTIILPSVGHTISKDFFDNQWVNITFESDVFAALSDGSKNDILNPFTEANFDTSVDPNLKKVYKRDPVPGNWTLLTRYTTDSGWPSDMSWTSEPRKETLRIKSGRLLGADKRYPKAINPERYQYQYVLYPEWLYSKISAVIIDWMNRIPQQIKTTKTVDQNTSPDVLEQTISSTLFSLWNSKRSSWNAELASTYKTGSKYTSTAAKVMYYLLMRYLDRIEAKVSGMSLQNTIENSINEAFTQAGINDCSYSQLKDAAASAKSLTELLLPRFPLAFVMNLTAPYIPSNPYSSWTEPFQCAVVHEPSFLSKPNYEKYYTPSGEHGNEQKCKLRYQNINLFSPGAGINDLIDKGFDAVNTMICSALDTGFTKLDEIAAAANTTVKNQVQQALDNITNEIHRQLLANLSNKITQSLEKSATMMHLNISIQRLNIPSIVSTVLGQSKDNGNPRYAHDLNISQHAINISSRIQQQIDQQYNYLSTEIKNEIMSVIDKQVLSVYTKVVSDTINNSKEKLKQEFGVLSSKLQKWANNQLSKLISSFIPAGLPLLLPIGWIMTLNVWYIDVSGQIPFFQVSDSYDETMAHPFWGHTAQEYTRRYMPVFIDLNGDGQPEYLIGHNRPIDFEYKTATCAIVPGKNKVTGMGDRIGGWDETSSYP